MQQTRCCSARALAAVLLLGLAGLLGRAPLAAAHGHAGCGHSLVAGEARRWSALHRQHRQMLEQQQQQQEQQPDQQQQQQQPAEAAAHADRPTPRRLAAAPGGTVPLRVWVEYQGTNSLSDDGRQRLSDTVNVALGVLQKFYKVRRPAPGRLLVKPFCRMWASGSACNLHQPDFLSGASDNSCGAAQINSSHIAAYEQCRGLSCDQFPGGSGEFTDYYLYITARSDEHCASGAVAWALPCLYDTETNRPLLGSANICPDALLKSEPEAAVAILLHELTHALGFTDDMFDKFIDADGAPRPKSEVVATQVDAYGRTTSYVITPTVAAEARAQFGCDTLPGAALENEGGQGSANAHWEYRLFQGELMVATNLFAVYGKAATLSRITLAFMQDTGWYDVDLDAAGFLNWGFRAGCSFAAQTCTEYAAANPGQQYFCTREQYADTVNTLCTFDGFARAKCEDAQFADGCIMKIALGTSPNCLSRAYAASAGDKFGWANGLSSRCVPVTWLFATMAYQFPESAYKDGWRDSMCYKTACGPGGKLTLDILGQQVACPSGQMVDLAQVMPNHFQKGLLGPCPDNAAMCSSLSCNDSCTVGGTCMEGRCYCNLMYTGPQCAKKLTPSGNYTSYVPVVDDGGAGSGAAFDNGYLMMSARLSSSQSALYLALDKYKAAVAQLAGVTTTRVAVLSFLTDSPASSLVGGRRLSALPSGGADSGADGGAADGGADGAGQPAAQRQRWAWPWALLPAGVDPAPDPAWRGGAAAPDVAGTAPRRRGLLQALGAGQLEVYSRIATANAADAEAITGRVNNATRQAAFDKALADAGLRLVPGSVRVRRAGAGGMPGGGGDGWGLPGINMSDPNTRRIIIIVAASLGAALAVLLLGWAIAACTRRQRARAAARGAAGAAGLHQGFMAGRHPGGGGGASTPGSGASSGSSGSAAAARPLFGGGRQQGHLHNPFALQPPPLAAAAAYAQGQPAGGMPPGGYTVAGRAFATAKEADDWALAMALSRSLQEQGLGGGAPQPPLGLDGRYLPPRQQQQPSAWGAAYPTITQQGWGGGAPRY